MIPNNLDEWNIKVIDKLIQFRDIESETFDFKGSKFDDLHEDICGMANTNGGFLVLGVAEKKGSDSKVILGFQKVGFDKGKEDYIIREVGNNIVRIDPEPEVTWKHIYDKTKFFTVLKINNVTSKKPHFIKNREQCYVRIHNSSRPASRSTILALFSKSVERLQSVEKLMVTVGLVKESLMHTSGDIHSTSPPTGTMRIVSIDLSFLRNAVLSCEWFLIENDLLGHHTSQSGYTEGVNSILYKLERLNNYIHAFNQENNEKVRDQLTSQLFSWSYGSSEVESVIKFLDKLRDKARKFLSENNS